MNRDWSLIRKIALAIKDVFLSDSVGHLEAIRKINGEIDGHMIYNIRLMFDEDLIKGSMIESPKGSIPNILRLSARGHDFIDAVTDPEVWTRITHEREEGKNSVPLEIIFSLRNARLRKQYGL